MTFQILVPTNQQLQLVILSDIFGRTPALLQLAQQLADQSIIIDPYQGQDMGFSDEKQAYSYFSQHVGLQQYQQLVSEKLAILDKELLLLGFSVGASVLWNLSASHSGNNIRKAWAFYGSQIRHQQQLLPGFEIELVLPISEPHFDVQLLAQTLATKPKVRLTQSEQYHGFMNALSDNFDNMAYQQYLHYLKREIQGVSQT